MQKKGYEQQSGFDDRATRWHTLMFKNNNLREKVHFLVVLADEAIAFKDAIMRFRNIQGLSQEEIKAIGVVSNEDLEMAQIEAFECAHELNQELKKCNYDRTMAYYIVYAAYLNLKIGNMAMSRQMLTRFHTIGVDIRHYTLAVQRQYEEVRKAVEFNQ